MSTVSIDQMRRINSDDKSFGKLLGQLATDSSTLVRNELTLAKKELMEKASIGGVAAAILIVGALMGLASLIFFGITAMELLALVLPRWGAALIIGMFLLIVAGVIVVIGAGRLKHLSLAPKQTIETLEEDKEWLKKLA